MNIALSSAMNLGLKLEENLFYGTDEESIAGFDSDGQTDNKWS